jgi:cytoskeletal protein RodZ
MSRPYNRAILRQHLRVRHNSQKGSRTDSEMRNWKAGLMRPIVGFLVWLLVAPLVSASALPVQDQVSASALPVQDQNASANTGSVANAASPPAETVPDSPGYVSSQTTTSNQQFIAQAASSQPQQVQEPVGTAAAEPVEATGVAASRPAGAAIAPAKQRRTRALLIKVSAVVGAGVAIGTVVALSHASPSVPPGAR